LLAIYIDGLYRDVADVDAMLYKMAVGEKLFMGEKQADVEQDAADSGLHGITSFRLSLYTL
jgi:hypothetical protein